MKKKLHERYQALFDQDGMAKKHAYENTLAFIHRWQQGRSLLEECQRVSFHIRPLLLFYGYTDLVKALILLYDPSYPATTNVLAHGVSTRKRKRKDYRFIDDEVKMQKHGLFPHLLFKMYDVQGSSDERFQMASLLLQLPFLQKTIGVDPRFKAKKIETTLPPLLIHYLLLYNLSMINRYETEWWGELIAQRSSADLPLIEMYLETCPRRCEAIIVEEVLALF
ncbi:YaaC family protein [Natribacillus halophilus]|uniref:YaaC-like Protein n=1 Tax=Natribacillus halophilus TaxID=549003 RepID=A0A1G8S8M5_9BACI|nr:YaaC family protein [Natribacillus halophilus]SDJ25584.1 YaaC-like Protein [Natribacillus halophilus]